MQPSTFTRFAARSVVLVACALASAPMDAGDREGDAISLITVPSAQAQALAYDAGTLRVIVPAARTGGRYAVLELAEDASYRTPAHMHPEMDETFYVLQGTLRLQIAGATHVLPAGSYVHVPRGTAHAQGSADGQPVRLLATFTPGAFEAFFADRVELARSMGRGHPEFQARMLEIVRRYPRWLAPADLPED